MEVGVGFSIGLSYGGRGRVQYRPQLVWLLTWLTLPSLPAILNCYLLHCCLGECETTHVLSHVSTVLNGCK